MKRSDKNKLVTPSQIKLLQVARRSMGLEEQDYRNILGIYGGVASAKALTQGGFDRVMTHLKRIGFEAELKPRPPRTPGDPADPVTVYQNKKILELFKALGWDGKRQQGFCRKLFRNLWPMNRGDAQQLIETLKKMEARGYRERGMPCGSGQQEFSQ